VEQPFEFEYSTREPAGDLARIVEMVFFARGTVPYAREKIAPTGSTVAIVVFGDPIINTADNGEGSSVNSDTGFLIGPHDRPVINEPTGETHVVGIVTTPVGCHSVFGVHPSEIRGDLVPIDSVWPAVDEMRALVGEGGTSDEKLARIEEFIHRNLTPPDHGLDRCAAAVAALEADPTRPVADIADELGISHGHLDREFTRIVGLTPRALSRLLRMRAMLAGLDVRGEVAWADLAHELGWFDQAHLIRDFKRHTGVTPQDYLEAQRAVYSPVEPGDAAGFVPEM